MKNKQPHAGSAHSGGGDVPQPQRPTPMTQMPRSLTFFLNAKERTAVLRSLRTIDKDRAIALLHVLGVTAGTPQERVSQ